MTGNHFTPPAVIPDNEDIVEPKSRRERFLSKIAGENDEIKPKSRREQFLENIAKDKAARSSKFIVNFDGSYLNEADPPVCDKTFAEIKAAYEKRLDVEARYGNYVLHLVFSSTYQYIYYCFFKTDYSEDTVYEITATIADDDTVDVRIGGDV